MATTSKPFTVIATTLETVNKSVDAIARYVNGNTDLTEDGKNASFTRNTKDHREFITRLENTLTEIETALTTRLQAAWDEQLPTAETDTAKLVVEMELARILNRGALKDTNDVIQWGMKQPPSPTRTALLTEFEERGMLTNDMVNEIVRASSPEFTKVATDIHGVLSALNSIIRHNIRELTAKLDNRGAESSYWLSAATMNEYLDVEVPGRIVVPTWTPTATDTLLQGRV